MTGRYPADLFQRAFIGRETEIAQLTSAFKRAVDGQGSLLMVVGEPGVGKTTVCEEFARHVEREGGLALVGHCYEEGSLSLPYLPFVEAMRTYVLTQDEQRLREELGAGAERIARIVPEVRDRIEVEPRPAGDPEEERYRLFQSVGDFIKAIGQSQPLMVVLEDLHDSDRATLSLLTHLMRTLSSARVLVVGTYRDVEVDRSHPLSSTLAELRRASNFGRVPLRGLTPDEVHRMLSSMTGQDVRWGLAETVHRQTEGNPLFVQEVLRYLAQSGLIAREGDRWARVGDDAPEMSIPEGLRDVIGKRLSGLSEGCDRLLAVASVIGREFRLDVLARVSGRSDDEMTEALAEARSAAVIEERVSVGAVPVYRFTHAFFRQTPYEEMIAPLRIKLHQTVARAIEEIFEGRLEEHAGELAEHSSYSADPSNLEKAVAYATMAAERAMGVFAYDEAARLLEQALRIQEVLDPDDKIKKCDLLLALGTALLPGGNARSVLDRVAPQAFALAEESGDRVQASSAAQMALEAFERSLGAHATGLPIAATWAQRAIEYAEDGSVDHVHAELTAGMNKFMTGQAPEAFRLFETAVSTARNLGDAETFFRAVWAWALWGLEPARIGYVSSLVDELVEWSSAGARPRTVAQAAWLSGLIAIGNGNRAQAMRLWDEVMRIAERVPDQGVSWRPLARQAIEEYLDGHLETAIETAERLQILTEELGATGVGAVYVNASAFWPLIHLGRSTAALVLSMDAIPQAYQPVMAILRFLQGDRAYAREVLSDWIQRDPLDEGQLFGVLWLAVAFQDHEATARVLDQWAPAHSLLAVLHTGFGNRPRLMGDAARMLGRPEEARAHYLESIELCTGSRFRTELVLTRLAIAELLAESFPDERANVKDHLDTVIPELRDMKMQAALDQAIALKERLDGTRTRERHPGGLTPREVEVLALIAAGRTDREIADALVVSARTVSTHVSSILGKINAANRTEAASYATRQGLA